MNLLPILPPPPASSSTPPILILRLPERCPSHLAAATIKVDPVPFIPLVSTFSATFEFVFTPNHRHDGINE